MHIVASLHVAHRARGFHAFFSDTVWFVSFCPCPHILVLAAAVAVNCKLDCETAVAAAPMDETVFLGVAISTPQRDTRFTEAFRCTSIGGVSAARSQDVLWQGSYLSR